MVTDFTKLNLNVEGPLHHFHTAHENPLTGQGKAIYLCTPGHAIQVGVGRALNSHRQTANALPHRLDTHAGGKMPTCYAWGTWIY